LDLSVFYHECFFLLFRSLPRKRSGLKKTEGGQTTVYVNRYYEKTGAEITTSYYLASGTDGRWVEYSFGRCLEH
jgi:hypothetical protein